MNPSEYVREVLKIKTALGEVKGLITDVDVYTSIFGAFRFKRSNNIQIDFNLIQAGLQV